MDGASAPHRGRASPRRGPCEGKARSVQRTGPVAVTRCVDRVDPDWPCDARALAAARAAAGDMAEPLQDAARDTTEQPVAELVGAPIDDVEEATEADAVPADEEPTTVRPSPIPPELLAWEVAAASPAPCERPASARGRIGKYEIS